MISTLAAAPRSVAAPAALCAASTKSTKVMTPLVACDIVRVCRLRSVLIASDLP